MSPTKKNGRRQNEAGKSANSSRDTYSTSEIPDTTRVSPSTTSDDKDSEEAFLRICFPGLPTARLKSAVGRCNGDMEHIMDWLLGEMHEKEGELQHALQRELSSTLRSTSASSSSASSSGGQLTNSVTGSDHGHFTDSIISGSASTITITSGVSGTSSSEPVTSSNSGSGSSRRSRNKKKNTRAMHISEFLKQHSTTLSSMSTYNNNVWLSSDDMNMQDRNTWSEIERLTYHLAMIFPQISRNAIRSTLHSCRLNVEETVARLANPPPPIKETTPSAKTNNTTRGLSHWRPGSNKITGTKQSTTVLPVTNKSEPKDESVLLDIALCQLTTIFPEHDMDTLVEALMQCHLKADAAVNYVLATNQVNKKTSKPTSWKNTSKTTSSQQQKQQHVPTSVQSPQAQKMIQQQQDFWMAHRYQREKEEATQLTLPKTKVITTPPTKSVSSSQPTLTSNQSSLPTKQSAWQTVGNSNTRSTSNNSVSQCNRIFEFNIEENHHSMAIVVDDDPNVCAQNALNLYEKRNEAFKRAAQAFRARNRNGTFGAALASFYASEGRDYDASMRRWNTRAAIGVLRSSQKQWNKEYVVDLHYMTVNEALEVALLAVQDWSVIEKKVMIATGKSTPRPLRIVTGAGSHSHDGRAKLFPRVQRALREAGWQVTAIDKGSFMVTNIRSNSNH